MGRGAGRVCGCILRRFVSASMLVPMAYSFQKISMSGGDNSRAPINPNASTELEVTIDPPIASLMGSRTPGTNRQAHAHKKSTFTHEH